jgi:pimeloyl-ACP methyl ester carboxylesterase
VLATQFGIVRDANGPRVDVTGATIYYEEHGDGAPLTLVHGRLASSAHWQPVVPELAESFRVIRPDSRGHGRSTNPAGELTYARIADDIAALIAALGLERPGGWSDGGQVTLELGARHAGVAVALIIAAFPDFDAGGLREAHRALLGADETGVPDPAHLDARRRVRGRDQGTAPRRRRAVAQTGTPDCPVVARLRGAAAGPSVNDHDAGAGARRRPRRAHPARPLDLALPGAPDRRACDLRARSGRRPSAHRLIGDLARPHPQA